MLTVFVARCWTRRLVSLNATIGVDDCLKVTFALRAWSRTMFGWACAESLFRRLRHLTTSFIYLSVRITWSRVTTESITLKETNDNNGEITYVIFTFRRLIYLWFSFEIRATTDFWARLVMVQDKALATHYPLFEISTAFVECRTALYSILFSSPLTITFSNSWVRLVIASWDD